MPNDVIKQEWTNAEQAGPTMLELSTFIPEMKQALRDAWSARGNAKLAETRIRQAERRTIPGDQFKYLLTALQELESR